MQVPVFVHMGLLSHFNRKVNADASLLFMWQQLKPQFRFLGFKGKSIRILPMQLLLPTLLLR